MKLLCKLFGCGGNSNVEIVAKVVTAGVPGAVNILGPDGRNHVLYYRNGDGAWAPVPLVEDFPA